MSKSIIAAVVLIMALGSVCWSDMMSKMEYANVVWTSPSADSSGSMPLGNGDLGINAWVESNGDLLFLISKTDAWNEEGELLKIGRVRISMNPNPFLATKPFKQTLDIYNGEMRVSAGDAEDSVNIRLWVDANSDVIWIEIDSAKPIDARVSSELWRKDGGSLLGYNSRSYVHQSADTIIPSKDNKIAWYHRNETSIWPWTLELQHLQDFAKTAKDPIINHSFGVVIQSADMHALDNNTLSTTEPVNKLAIRVNILTGQSQTADAFVEKLFKQAVETARISLPDALNKHNSWWNKFWERSFIRVSGRNDAELVSKGYALQRYVSACAGRGQYPIKFNGSIFTFDTKDPADANGNPDYRRWGGGYWFQNTRLAYWPMLASGDWDMLIPWLKMYKDIIPLAKYRTKDYFGHSGTFYPETMTFYGTYLPDNYGLDRTGKHHSAVDNGYIRYYWSGGLELTLLMLDRYQYGKDAKFVREYLLPISDGVIDFYDKHYTRNEQGKLVFKPAASLETWQDVVDPTPEIAGLRSVLPKLLDLPENLTGKTRRAKWSRLLSETPELPTTTERGHRIIAPAAEILGPALNSENPELYTVFPYRLFSLGKRSLDMANYTYNARKYLGNEGWRQDPIQAAMLGRADEARRMVFQRFTTKHTASRFDAFWGPNFDWIPDQDHGSVAVMALQTMLLQNVDDKIMLMPAWPKDWDVEFKLHAPNKTVIEGIYRNGVLEKLSITPSERKKDLVLCGPLAGNPPVIKKLGTTECDLVETTPLVFNDKLYRLEWVRMAYKHTSFGDECFRLVDMETGKGSAPFAWGNIFASGYAEDGTVYAFGVKEPRNDINVFASKDLVNWETWPAFKTENWSLFNTSVCKGENGRYVMAFEIGAPEEETGRPFTCRFAVSDDLKNWTVLSREHVYSMDRYTACPTIRYFNGWYYMVYLEMQYEWEFDSYLVRTKDFIHWQSSPHNPILKYSPEDKLIANPNLNEAERKRIAEAVNINNSDFDICEFRGKTIITYSWGSQKGQEFLAQAEYDGSMQEFFEGFFNEIPILEK